MLTALEHSIVARWWKRLRPFWRYTIIVGSAFVISVADVFWAAHVSGNGGRGGAIAAGLALSIVFLRPDWGHRNYKRRMAVCPSYTDELKRVAYHIEAVVAWLTIDAADRGKQDKALFIASAIGILFWGFGDIFADSLARAYPCIVRAATHH